MTLGKFVIALAIISASACAEKKPETQSGRESDTASSQHRNSTTVTPQMIMPPMMPPIGLAPPGAVTGTPPGGTTPPVTTTPGTPLPGTTPPASTAPTILASFQSLPMLLDADGNTNDASATYNLTVEDNVPVNVVTPAGKWITPMMRFNGFQLPPVIVAKRGTNVTVNVQNNLAESTTIHWHGFKIPAAQDGGPDEPIPAGTSRTYNFQLAQSAAPLWFHPHAEGTTATQVYNGLAGAFIVTDAITQELELTKKVPSGNYDIPLMIQDRTFAADNGTGIRPLVYLGGGMMGMDGMIGDQILVNGVVLPSLNVETRQYRFRLFNGSNARTYDFALSTGASFSVIGTDGGLLPSPVTTDNITLAAGERAEIVVDFRTLALNSSIALINRADANAEVMRFEVTTTASDDIVLYSNLPLTADIYQRLAATSANKSRNFVFNMAGMMTFAINGKLFDITRIDELVANGATEIWNISNTTHMAHPFHAHAIQWQILDRNGVPANGIDLGWKDTVLVQPGETVRFIGKFDPVINKGLYMFHCHILEHEEAGMMGTFFIQ